MPKPAWVLAAVLCGIVHLDFSNADHTHVDYESYDCQTPEAVECFNRCMQCNAPCVTVNDFSVLDPNRANCKKEKDEKDVPCSDFCAVNDECKKMVLKKCTGYSFDCRGDKDCLKGTTCFVKYPEMDGGTDQEEVKCRAKPCNTCLKFPLQECNGEVEPSSCGVYSVNDANKEVLCGTAATAAVCPITCDVCPTTSTTITTTTTTTTSTTVLDCSVGFEPTSTEKSTTRGNSVEYIIERTECDVEVLVTAVQWTVTEVDSDGKELDNDIRTDLFPQPTGLATGATLFNPGDHSQTLDIIALEDYDSGARLAQNFTVSLSLVAPEDSPGNTCVDCRLPSSGICMHDSSELCTDAAMSPLTNHLECPKSADSTYHECTTASDDRRLATVASPKILETHRTGTLFIKSQGLDCHVRFTGIATVSPLLDHIKVGIERYGDGCDITHTQSTVAVKPTKVGNFSRVMKYVSSNNEFVIPVKETAVEVQIKFQESLAGTPAWASVLTLALSAETAVTGTAPYRLEMGSDEFESGVTLSAEPSDTSLSISIPEHDLFCTITRSDSNIDMEPESRLLVGVVSLLRHGTFCDFGAPYTADMSWILHDGFTPSMHVQVIQGEVVLLDSNAVDFTAGIGETEPIAVTLFGANEATTELQITGESSSHPFTDSFSFVVTVYNGDEKVAFQPQNLISRKGCVIGFSQPKYDLVEYAVDDNSATTTEEKLTVHRSGDLCNTETALSLPVTIIEGGDNIANTFTVMQLPTLEFAANSNTATLSVYVHLDKVPELDEIYTLAFGGDACVDVRDVPTTELGSVTCVFAGASTTLRILENDQTTSTTTFTTTSKTTTTTATSTYTTTTPPLPLCNDVAMPCLIGEGACYNRADGMCIAHVRGTDPFCNLEQAGFPGDWVLCNEDGSVPRTTTTLTTTTTTQNAWVKNGPLVATIEQYPGADSNSVPSGSASVVDYVGSGHLNFSWDLENIRPTLKATLGAYPGSSADVFPTGTVAVEDQPDGTIKLYYDIEAGLATHNHSAGLHIHEGTSCEIKSEVGGHYWRDSSGPNSISDPWTTRYTASNGAAKGSFVQLNAGFNFEDNKGHVVVVHSEAGGRLACGVLNVASGGIHIHTGSSCANAEGVGEHHWNKESGGIEDPWTTTYTAGAAPISSGTASVRTGQMFSEVKNRAVVVHSAADGSRIGCGVLEIDTSEPEPEEFRVSDDAWCPDGYKMASSKEECANALSIDLNDLQDCSKSAGDTWTQLGDIGPSPNCFLYYGTLPVDTNCWAGNDFDGGSDSLWDSTYAGCVIMPPTTSTVTMTSTTSTSSTSTATSSTSTATSSSTSTSTSTSTSSSTSTRTSTSTTTSTSTATSTSTSSSTTTATSTTTSTSSTTSTSTSTSTTTSTSTSTLTSSSTSTTGTTSTTVVLFAVFEFEPFAFGSLVLSTAEYVTFRRTLIRMVAAEMDAPWNQVTYDSIDEGGGVVRIRVPHTPCEVVQNLMRWAASLGENLGDVQLNNVRLEGNAGTKACPIKADKLNTTTTTATTTTTTPTILILAPTDSPVAAILWINEKTSGMPRWLIVAIGAGLAVALVAVVGIQCGWNQYAVCMGTGALCVVAGGAAMIVMVVQGNLFADWCKPKWAICVVIGCIAGVICLLIKLLHHCCSRKRSDSADLEDYKAGFEMEDVALSPPKKAKFVKAAWHRADAFSFTSTDASPAGIVSNEFWLDASDDGPNPKIMTAVVNVENGKGLGIGVGNEAGFNYVRGMKPGGNAEQCGSIQAGDRIKTINKTNVSKLSREKCIAQLKHASASGKVTLGLNRPATGDPGNLPSVERHASPAPAVEETTFGATTTTTSAGGKKQKQIKKDVLAKIAYGSVRPKPGDPNDDDLEAVVLTVRLLNKGDGFGMSFVGPSGKPLDRKRRRKK